MQSPEYRYAISTDNLREAVAEAGSIMAELLEEVLVASNDQSEEEATADLMRVLARYREQNRYADPSLEIGDDEDDESAELVE
jgi:hypothetical protein